MSSVKKTETAGTPENRRNKIFAPAEKMVHGSRGVEIKRRYCFFRQANANGKIVAPNEETARRDPVRIERYRELTRALLRTFHLVKGES